MTNPDYQPPYQPPIITGEVNDTGERGIDWGNHQNDISRITPREIIKTRRAFNKRLAKILGDKRYNP